MDEITRLAKELRDELESLDLFKEYKRMRELVDSDKEIQQMKVEITKSVSNQKVHDELINQYNAHPLISNLLELENEVKSYLIDVTEIINKK